MWECQLNFLSTIAPKNLVSVTLLIQTLSIITEGNDSEELIEETSFLRPKSIKLVFYI